MNESTPEIDDRTGKILPAFDKLRSILNLITSNPLDYSLSLHSEVPDIEKILNDVVVHKQWEITAVDRYGLDECKKMGFEIPENKGSCINGDSDDVGRYLTRYPQTLCELKKAVVCIREVFKEEPLSISVSFSPEGDRTNLWITIVLDKTGDLLDQMQMERSIRSDYDTELVALTIGWTR